MSGQNIAFLNSGHRQIPIAVRMMLANDSWRTADAQKPCRSAATFPINTALSAPGRNPAYGVESRRTVDLIATVKSPQQPGIESWVLPNHGKCAYRNVFSTRNQSRRYCSSGLWCRVARKVDTNISLPSALKTETVKKVKQSLYTPWRRLGGEEVYLLLILDLGTRWGWVVSVRPRSRFTPGESTPGTHCTGGWVGPRAGLDTEDRGKILCPRRGSDPDRPVVQPVVRHYTAWANPAPDGDSPQKTEEQRCYLQHRENLQSHSCLHYFTSHNLTIWIGLG
jgi:hypothetical protein